MNATIQELTTLPPLLAAVIRFKIFHFGAHHCMLVVPEDAGTDIGSRIWQGSLVCARVLLQYTCRIAGAKVLELGAGTGLCGLLAADMGARQVVITDCSYLALKAVLPSVLMNDVGQRGTGPACWGMAGDQIHVRRHLWQNDAARSPGRGPVKHWSNVPTGPWGDEGIPDELDADETFDFIIGSDVLYFDVQVTDLLATLATRLTDSGRGLLVITQRKSGMYTRLLEGFPQVGLTIVEESQVAVDSRDLYDDIHETPNTLGYRMVQVMRTPLVA